MNIRFVIFSCIVFFSSIFAGNCFAQNDFTSEKDLIKQAEKLFATENYVEAKPLFSQLLSLHPTDINYTFKFGICEIYANRNKSQAIQWLEKATQAPNAEPKYFYYLGFAYHLNYMFDDAITAYTTFLQKADKKIVAEYPAQRQINMCNYAKQLLVEVQDLVVVESKEVKREEFYRNYMVRQDAGKLIIKPDEFKSALDLKEGESSIIFFPKENPVIFYSSYGEDKSHGKDIFKVAKLPSGQWSKPENLGSVVNTMEDEDFSYITPDGLTLFFCSKGHNSIGGYDVFKTTREENTNNWTQPINMGFAVNSPDDDILYVADPEKGVAYFATTRQSVQNMILVHKLNIDEKPLENVIIKGRLSVDADPTLMDAKITMFTGANDEIVGEFNTKRENGDYLLIVPAGQRYKMVINVEGMDEPITQMIEVPVQKKAEAMEQKIAISKINGKDTAVVTNNFWGLVKTSDRLLDPRVLKEQARLMASLPEEEIEDTLLATTEKIEVIDTVEEVVTNEKKTINKNISDNELVNIAFDDADKAKKEAEEYQENATIAYYIAQKRSELVAKQTEAIDELEETIKQASGNASQKDLEDLKKLKQQAAQCGLEAKVAFNIAKKMENEAAVTLKEAELTLSFANELEAAAKSSSDEKAIKILENQKKKLEELDKQRGAYDYSSQKVRDISNNKLTSAQEAKTKARKLQEETVSINGKIQQLKQSIETSADEKQKEEMQKQLQALEKTEQESQLKAQTAFKLAKELESEAGNLNQEAELISDVLSEINTGYDKNKVPSQKIDKTVLNEQIQAIQTKTTTYLKEEETILARTETGVSATTTANSSSEKSATTQVTIVSKADSLLAFDRDTIGLSGIDSVLIPSLQEYYNSEQLSKWLSLVQEDIVLLKDSLKKNTDKNTQQEISVAIKDLEQLLQEKQVEKQEIYQEAATMKFTALTASSEGTKPSKKEEKEKETKYEEKKQLYFKNKGFVLDKSFLIDTASSKTEYQKALFYKKQYQFYNREIDELQDAIDASTDPAFTKDAEHKIKTYRSLAAVKYSAFENYTLVADSLQKKEAEPKLAVVDQTQLADTTETIITTIHSGDVNLTAASDTTVKKIQENEPKIKLPLISRTDFAMEDIAMEVEKAKNFEREAKNYEQEADMISQNIESIPDSAIVHRAQKDIDSLERMASYQRERADTCQARIHMMKQLLTAEIKAKNDSIQKTIEAKTVEKEKKPKKKSKKALEKEELAKQQQLAEKAKADSLAAIKPIRTDTSAYSNEGERLQKLADYYAELASNEKEDLAKLRSEASDLRKTALATADSSVKNNTLKKVLEIEEKANEKSQHAQSLSNISNDYRQQAKEEFVRSGDTLNLTQLIKGNKKLESILEMYENAYRKNREFQVLLKQQEEAETMAAATKDVDEKQKLTNKAEALKSKASSLYEQSSKAYYDANKELYTLNKNNLKKITQKSFNNSDLMMANLLEDEVIFYSKKVDSLNAKAANINDPEKLNPVFQEMIRNQELATEKQQKAGMTYMKFRQDTSIHQLYFSANDFIHEAAKWVSIEDISAESLVENTVGILPTLEPKTENITTTQTQVENTETSQGTKTEKENTADHVSEKGSATSSKETSSQNTMRNTSTADGLSSISNTELQLLQDPKVREVLSSLEYKNYKIISLEANVLKQEGQVELDNAKEWNDKGTEANNKAKAMLKDAEKLKGKAEIAATKAKAEEQSKLAKEYFAKSDSVKKIADNIVSQSVAKTNESELFLQSLDKITYQKIMSIKSDTAVDNLVSKAMLDGIDIAALIAKAESSLPTTAQNTSIQKTENKNSSQTTTTQHAQNTNTAMQGTTTAAQNTAKQTIPTETQNTVQKTESKTNTTQNITQKVEAKTTIPTHTQTAKQSTEATATSKEATTNKQTAVPSATQSSKNVVTNVGKLKTLDYVFATLNQSAYTSSNPIPVDVKTPEGIYFMVQVGAFKNPIPQDLFQGITPITGETTPQGVIRYSAGMFKTFESCNYAKNMIRGMGYNDAFVVAYKDGKRVSLQDALAKLALLEGQAQLSYKQSEQLELAQLKELKLPIASASEQEIKNSITNASDIAKTVGLVYTVQIGVYSNPVTPDKLYNITPISYIKTSSGYIRYSTGQFKNFTEADKRKNEVVKIGIQDAFVTAYYNGDRISIADAGAIERGDKNVVQRSTSESSTAAMNDGTSKKATSSTKSAADNSIVFKVQMGAFKGDVAVQMVNIFLQFNSYGVEQFKNENGYTIYTAGSFPDLASASALKDKVVKAGIPDAFVIAYNNGKRISVTEAVQKLNQ